MSIGPISYGFQGSSAILILLANSHLKDLQGVAPLDLNDLDSKTWSLPAVSILVIIFEPRC
jgi:hypothetical protein